MRNAEFGMEEMCNVGPFNSDTPFRKATTEDILGFGRRILDTLGDRVVPNVGDQAPPDADVEKVAALASVCG